jgi:hypothetical protein
MFMAKARRGSTSRAYNYKINRFADLTLLLVISQL